MTNTAMTQASDFADTPRGWQERWMRELAAAKKANKKWKENAKRITKVFLDERADAFDTHNGARLNVFSANVITLRAMLFGQIPRVEISRRYEDANDDVARVGAEILERLLNADVGKQFSFSIGAALDDRLLVGLGCGRVAYEAEFETIQHEAITTRDGRVLADKFEEERKTQEAAPVYYINWRDVEWSPARTWDEVRWVGFKNYLTRDKLIERFGEKIGEAIPLGTTAKRSHLKGGIEDDPWQKGEVWEIWSLEDRTVWWVSEGMDVICDAKEDTLQLTSFFPCPQFLLANPTSEKYQPRADYILAQDQYEEVNDLTARIRLLQKAIKVVGVYDKQADGVQRMFNEATENQLIPVDNWAMFAEKGGIKGQIDWLPIEEVAKALTMLRDYRTELINLLFQVTGMSDIMRGATVAGETATAQSIKAKFASVRVQFMQDEFARFATDLQRLRAEVICNHFEDETILQQSNMQQTPDAQYIPQAMEMLRNLDAFRISIKSETLAAQDMAALRQEKGEFIQGLSMFLTAAQPLVQQYPAAAPVLLELLKWTMTGFKGASSIEGTLDKAIAQLQQSPPKQPEDPQKAKADAAKQVQQMKLQGVQATEQIKSGAKTQEIATKTQSDLIKINAQTQAELKKQAAQFAFETRENQRAQAVDIANNLTRRPNGQSGE